MTELLLHFTVPFAAFSYFRKPKLAFLASLFAVLPDLDVLVGVHRSWTHSIFVVSAFCGIMLLLIRVLKPGLLDFGFLVSAALVTHLLLDLFTTYTPILWPLTGQSFYVSFRSRVRVDESVHLYVDPRVSTHPTDFTPFQFLDGPLFTSEGFVISLVLVTCVFLSRYSSKLRAVLEQLGSG